jgi:hypothetical protein
MSSRVLVVATSDVGADEIGPPINERFGEDVEVHVIAPASGLSRLDWLTNAEDDARANAADRAGQAAEAIASDDVVARVGDTDPIQAIADELRRFPADEIVLVTREDGELSWLEGDAADAARKHFRIPVTRLTVG